MFGYEQPQLRPDGEDVHSFPHDAARSADVGQLDHRRHHLEEGLDGEEREHRVEPRPNARRASHQRFRFFDMADASGRPSSHSKRERARAEQALKAYEFSVLLAFAEVEDALAAVRTLADEYLARSEQVIAARSASTLSRARYDGGVTSYLEVLDLERSLFRAEIAASQVRRAQLVAVVDLYKALGGGWNAAD